MAEKNQKNTQTAAGFRELPNSVEAERNLLCCVFKKPDNALEILSDLSESDFYEQSHRKIFNAARAVANSDKTVSFANVVDELRRAGELKNVGDVDYITHIISLLPSGARYKEYADVVMRCALMRKLIDACGEIIEKAYVSNSSEEALTFAESKIFELSETHATGGLTPFKDVVSGVIRKIEQRYVNPSAYRGVMTGFSRFDKMTNGFKGGELIVLAARPGVGKSAMAMNIVENAARDGRISAVFSLEMTNEQILERLLSSIAGVPLSAIKSGKLNDSSEFAKLQNAHRIISEHFAIFGNDSGNIKPADIRSQCRRLKIQTGLDLIVVDYLGLMTADSKSDRDGRQENRQVEVSVITRTLKMLAKELNTPILLLSQLNRSSDSMQAKGGAPMRREPVLSDLRESGAIEQDADMVLFIHRPDGEQSEEGLVELIVAKHRNGETGKIPLHWIGKYVRFTDSDIFTQKTEAPSVEQNDENVVLGGSETEESFE